MGITPLKQFLQSLCFDSLWNYAVFWKLHNQSQILLTWEDGYCDIPRLRESTESILDDICFKDSDEILFSSGELSVNENSVEYPVGLDEMSSVRFTLGEGVVGEVAYTGDHCWVLSDDLLSGDITSKLISQCPDEWLLQFATGIKTIVLVPVVPHGVLQLGSLETVAEDLMLVAYIKDKFNSHQYFAEAYVPFTSNREFLSQSSLMCVPMEDVDGSSAITINKMKSEDSNAVDIVKPTSHKWPISSYMSPRCMVPESCHISGENMPKILSSTDAIDLDLQSLGLIEVSKPLNQSLSCEKSELDMTSINMFRLSCLEELQACSYSYNNKDEVLGEYANKTGNYSEGGVLEPPFVDKDADNMVWKTVSDFCSFPKDSELHDALGPSFMDHAYAYSWESSVSGEDARSSSNMFPNGNIIPGSDSSTWESSGWYVKDDEAEHLLQTVVTNACSGSDDYSSNGFGSVKSSTISSGKFAASSIARQALGNALLGEDKVPWSHWPSASVARERTAATNSDPSSSSLESIMTALIEEEQQQKKKNGYRHLQKESKLSISSKRRTRPGENQRSRPRDRQLIQDRVKELRELVPDGVKCSIDGLLDRTIKHMLFLRSVTDQADKLRQRVHQEVTGQKNLKSAEVKSGRQNGASWAFELGSDHQVCPIVVEDLEYPGQMLIEMLCNDHGRFLEIAEMIRRLNLTILKGAMERRSDNTWAHFIVEASRGFHRLDIFWPLMQLLQQNQPSISSRI